LGGKHRGKIIFPLDENTQVAGRPCVFYEYSTGLPLDILGEKRYTNKSLYHFYDNITVQKLLFFLFSNRIASPQKARFATTG